ncbi:MAG: hypothetical protein JWO13_2252 [Acidobacteriales bacterium]|nr:hypothetical protein [Terriglobales bacterium]
MRPEKREEMPHDKNGALLKVGDEVIIRAKVESLNTGAEYCNVNVKTNEPMFPSDQPTTIVLNTRQVELANPEPVPAAAETEAPAAAVPQGDGDADAA